MLDLSIIHIQQQEGTGETTTTNNNEEEMVGEQQSDISASDQLNQANPLIDIGQSDMSMIEHSDQ